MARRGYNCEIMAKFGYELKIAVLGHNWEAKLLFMCMRALSTCYKTKKCTLLHNKSIYSDENIVTRYVGKLGKPTAYCIENFLFKP
jgi:hypothetical protein